MKLLKSDRSRIINDVIGYLNVYYGDLPFASSWSRSEHMLMFGEDALVMPDKKESMLQVHRDFLDGNHNEALVLFEKEFIGIPSMVEYVKELKDYYNI